MSSVLEKLSVLKIYFGDGLGYPVFQVFENYYLVAVVLFIAEQKYWPKESTGQRTREREKETLPITTNQDPAFIFNLIYPKWDILYTMLLFYIWLLVDDIVGGGLGNVQNCLIRFSFGCKYQQQTRTCYKFNVDVLFSSFSGKNSFAIFIMDSMLYQLK